ncbi:serine protease [Pantoea sp. CCBC3-3-1]|uniref:trypsin-like serine peptidase n=1 Tax=Pantoea sp. CCBC3-3-1 TaxID=2490851 RepID=UPI0011BD67E1|nr:trypsin-like serine protease [Pantoea sp. CCBC3-3-1]
MKIKTIISGSGIILCLLIPFSGTARAENIKFSDSAIKAEGHCNPGDDIHTLFPSGYSLPSVVMIYVNDSSGKPVDWGTGTFISPDKILTAGHVAYNMQQYQKKGKKVYITAGLHEPEPGTAYEIKSIAIHPEMNLDTSDHDIAVITTTKNYPTRTYPITEITADLPDAFFGSVSYPSGLIEKIGKFNQYTARFKIDGHLYSSAVALTKCLTYGGESGAALIGYQNDSPLNGKIVGVLSSGSGDHPGDPTTLTYYTTLSGSNYKFITDNL